LVVAVLRLCGGYRRRILPEIEVFDLAHIYGARKALAQQTGVKLE